MRRLIIISVCILTTVFPVFSNDTKDKEGCSKPKAVSSKSSSNVTVVDVEVTINEDGRVIAAHSLNTKNKKVAESAISIARRRKFPVGECGKKIIQIPVGE
jgi:hypothetical protein